jgi:hypothetical protein
MVYAQGSISYVKACLNEPAVNHYGTQYVGFIWTPFWTTLNDDGQWLLATSFNGYISEFIYIQQ